MTNASRKHTVAFVLEVFVVLPIVFGARLYHGYGSYQIYYDTRVNDEQSKPVSIPEKIAERPHYTPDNGAREKTKSRFTGIPLSVNAYTKLKNYAFPYEKFHSRNGVDRKRNPETLIGARCNRRNQTFCEDVPDYPIEFVNRAFLRNSSLLHYVHEDIIGIVSRADTDEETLCLSTEQIIRPKAAVNIENKWLYVLQSNDSNFHQSIRVEICQELNNKCKLIDGFAEGYITLCKQKYVYHEMSAISNDGEIIRDYFRFPASCCCHVQFQTGDGDIE